MNKKLLFVCLIIALFLTLPAFQGNATVSPEDLEGDNVVAQDEEGNETTIESQDGTYTIDDNTIRIETIDANNTRIFLNETYQVDIAHYSDYFEVFFSQIYAGGLAPNALATIVGVRMETNATTTTTIVTFPDDVITISFDEETGNLWLGFDYLGIEILANFLPNGGNGTFKLYDHYYGITVEISPDFIFIDYQEEELSLTVNRTGVYQWMVTINDYEPVDAYYEPGVSLIVYYGTEGIFLEIPADPTIGLDAPIIIAFTYPVLTISYWYITICIFPEKVVIDYWFIVIVIYIYEYVYIEKIVIIYYEIIIIYYITIVELLIVIIYYTIEIKIYVTQIIIVYSVIEITIVFVSIEIWYVIVVWHIDIWVIKIEITINIIINILPVLIIFIFVPFPVPGPPIFVPFPVFVPVFINKLVYIYIPYYPRMLFIDVHDEDLAMPTHTIEYNVTNQLGNPVNDATVTVDYQGTTHPTTFIANGIYRVQLPASTVDEEIIVTATKPWYPDAVLRYTLEVSWNCSITTTTTQASLPIATIIASLFAAAIASVVLRKRKKKII